MVLAALWGRAAVEGAAELEAARAAEARGDLLGARRGYLYAMGWYAPAGSAAHEAADALWALSERALSAGDPTLALAAARDLRAGVLSTRWLACPLCDHLAPANDRIADLMARAQVTQPTAHGRTEAELRSHHLALLQLDFTPSPTISMLIAVCFVGWIAGAALFIRRSFTPEGGWSPRQGLIPGGVTVAMFAGWLWGLWVA